MYVTISMAGPFWVVYATDVIGIAPSEWGYTMTVAGVSTAITALLSGHLIDRFGRRRTVLLSLMFMPILMLSYVFCKTFIHVLTFWTLISILLSFLTPAFQALFIDLTPNRLRGRVNAALGINPFFVQPRGGTMVGIGYVAYIPIMLTTMVSGYIYEINPKFPWFLLSFTLFLSFLLILLYVHEPESPEE